MAGSARFQRAERLRNARDFKRLGLGGERVASSFFVVLVLNQGNEAQPKLGITTSRRVGGAVQRNRLKRLLREWFRSRKETFPRGLEIVVIGRRAAASLGLSEVGSDLDQLLTQVPS